MRTISDISHLFQPMENKISEWLIPALIEKSPSPTERKILAMPVGMGGIGLSNPVEMAEMEYQASFKMTRPLTDLIYQQIDNMEEIDIEQLTQLRQALTKEKAECNKNRLVALYAAIEIIPETKRALELACEKGASTWLQTNPSKERGFVLNKQELHEAICLRYGRVLKNVPSVCAYDVSNRIDHCLTCKKWGFVILRHNALRNTQADLFREVCKEVQVVPSLLSLASEEIQGSTEHGARLDIS